MSPACDVAIVGGGIVGLATARELARRGLCVRIFDRGRAAGEQSTRAWGFVRQQGRAPAELPLARDAARRWPELSRELGADTGYVRSGVLVTAETGEDEARLASAAQEARAHGIQSEMVTSGRIASIHPDARPIWRSGLFTREDGQADPHMACAAFLGAVRTAGVEIVENAPVDSLDIEAGRVRGVVVRGERHAASAVLCAAGVGTAALLRPLGVMLPIQIVRSSAAMTGPVPGGARPRSMTPVWSPRVSFRPRMDGGYTFSNGYHALDSEHDLSLDSFRGMALFGPEMWRNRHTLKLRLGRESLRRVGEELSGRPGRVASSEPPVNMAWVKANHARLCEALPACAGVEIAAAWAGRIDVTPDQLPILGRVASHDGLFVAAGFSAHGFSLSPTLGAMLADLVSGAGEAPELRPFRLTRFAERDFGTTAHALN